MKIFKIGLHRAILAWAAMILLPMFFPAAMAAQSAAQTTRTIPLPSSKEIMEPVPGDPQRTNSLPMQMAISPDGRYIAVVNAGYGTYESKYEQSIAMLDTQTGRLLDFPNGHTPRHAKQTLYEGLAFSSDGRHLYATIASLTNPVPAPKDAADPDSADIVGNGIVVYGFTEGKVVEERILPIPLQRLANGKRQNEMTDQPLPAGTANPFPSGIAVVDNSAKNGGDEILVADNLSDDALLIQATDGTVLHRFDLSTSNTVPASYPIAAIATRDGSLGFIALWNGSAVAELDLRSSRVLQILPLLPPPLATDPSSHPAAMVLSHNESTLYVALANRDSVAAIDLRTERAANGRRRASTHGAMHLLGFFDTRLPGQTYFGAVPDALALSPDGRRLYVADASLDAVAVFNARSLIHVIAEPIHAEGFIPTEWYPTALFATADHLYVATGKGQGTGPNNFPQRQVANGAPQKYSSTTYIATLLYGSLAAMDLHAVNEHLPALSKEVMESNRMHAAQQQILFRSGTNPIRHIIYILKENRSYDQVFGDLNAGNNDPSLTMYGWAITPNQHKLAEQFGILDNFYVSGEVSGDGHVWSTAAITSDYTEKTWQQSYRGGQRLYDYEGIVAKGNPLLERIPDIDDPGSGYLWTNLARHHRTYYHFGEFVSTTFCSASTHPSNKKNPRQGTPEPAPVLCARNYIRKGEPIPANYGGGISQYPWPIPLIARNVATKPELVGHFDPQFPDFQLAVPDQLRVAEFLTHFDKWVAERAMGHDRMPQFVLLRLPDDHTAGTTPGKPRPKASVADNDLAVGRVVDAVSHSAYWNDTAIFILEDDAQSGADHVDAHRSLMLVVSKYAPRPNSAGIPFLDHHFYTTVSTVRTMESLMNLPPMNNNDAFAPLMAPEFSGGGTQPAFTADYANRDNGLIYQANTASSPGAKESAQMDFRQADMADTQKLNVILWRDARGSAPIPPQLLTARHPSQNRERTTDRDGDKD
jgi:DNA-binding beta-propeller fold protein YncE